MNSERFRRIHDLVQAALDRPEGERESFVREQIGGDEVLGGEILRPLEAHDQPGVLDRRLSELASRMMRPSSPRVNRSGVIKSSNQLAAGVWAKCTAHATCR